MDSVGLRVHELCCESLLLFETVPIGEALDSDRSHDLGTLIHSPRASCETEGFPSVKQERALGCGWIRGRFVHLNTHQADLSDGHLET